MSSDEAVEAAAQGLTLFARSGRWVDPRPTLVTLAATVRAEAVADERRRIADELEDLANKARAAANTVVFASSQSRLRIEAGAYDAAARLVRTAAGSVPVATPEPDFAASLGKHAAYISSTVTASYPNGMDTELVMRRRVGKIFVEAGELGDAIEGWTGENPRKGVYATREDVIKELIDCASASLCAIEYMTGDEGRSVALVARQVAGNAQRLSEAIPDRCEQVATPPAEPAARVTRESIERGAAAMRDAMAAPSQPWSDPDHDVAGDMRRAASGLSATPRPALCEHGSTGSHFESIASQRYGGWCPGPTCEHGQTKPHSFQKLSGGFHYGCPGPVSVPKESSE